MIMCLIVVNSPYNQFGHLCSGRILNGGSKKQRKRRKKSGRKTAVTTEATEGSSVAVEKKALYVNLRDDDPNLIL